MQEILLVTFPFFALVLGGYLAARFRVLQLDAIPGLNGFVLYFALPCMLYRFGADTPIDKLLSFGLFATYLLCAMLMVAMAIVFARGRRIGIKDASFGALVAAFPNSGFMGMPLLGTLVGEAAAGPLLISISIDMVITSSVCIALANRAESSGKSMGASLLQSIKGIAVNPLPWAILLGGAASATQFRLPLPVADTVNMLANAGPPTALFTIGAVLARSQMRASSNVPRSGQTVDVLFVVILKLFVHPLMILAVGSLAISFGLDLEPTALALLALVASLPSASNVPMLAERFQADTGRVARIVLFSTALSFGTFSWAVIWLT